MYIEMECVPMSDEQLRVLVQFFKVMADESRLKIIGLLSTGERSVGELAELLGLQEPTVSHHLGRLRELGLVEVRAEGTTRYYWLNRRRLDALNREVLRVDEADSWIGELDMDEAERKILSDYVQNGRLKQIPTKQKKLLIILRWLAAKFEPEKRYSEKEVNDILSDYHEDYASLRRELIDFHLLERESGGSLYWRPAPQTTA